MLRVHSLRLLQLVLGLNQIHYLIVLPALLQVLLEEQELLPLEQVLHDALFKLAGELSLEALARSNSGTK